MRITTGWSLNDPTAANAVHGRAAAVADGGLVHAPCLMIKATPPTAAQAGRVVDARAGAA
jgi:hypothetical protein